jgi:hypothetical protein
MSTPYERTQAVLRTRDLLTRLASISKLKRCGSAHCHYSGAIRSPLILTCRLRPIGPLATVGARWY